MSKRYFITGTDTEVGKTYVSCLLLKYFHHQKQLSTIAIKPIASGSDMTCDGLRNSDALALQHHASILLPYPDVNPFTFAPPIAPHVAAKLIQTELTVSGLLTACQPALTHPADIHLIEGVGGWQVPLNEHETMADLAGALQAKIILVVGIKLGCINHALLTFQSIAQQQLPMAGWIANCICPETAYPQESIATLQHFLPIPLLAQIDYQATQLTTLCELD